MHVNAAHFHGYSPCRLSYTATGAGMDVCMRLCVCVCVEWLSMSGWQVYMYCGEAVEKELWNSNQGGNYLG